MISLFVIRKLNKHSFFNIMQSIFRKDYCSPTSQGASSVVGQRQPIKDSELHKMKWFSSLLMWLGTGRGKTLKITLRPNFIIAYDRTNDETNLAHSGPDRYLPGLIILLRFSIRHNNSSLLFLLIWIQSRILLGDRIIKHPNCWAKICNCY